jgi:hypothetical protein
MMRTPLEADSARLKEQIRQYWEAEPCGTRGVSADERRQFFAQIERERYEWEPYIPRYARFERGRGKKLLEIGVGAGTDFTNWVRNGAIATGIDLTERGVSLTKERDWSSKGSRPMSARRTLRICRSPIARSTSCIRTVCCMYLRFPRVPSLRRIASSSPGAPSWG